MGNNNVLRDTNFIPRQTISVNPLPLTNVEPTPAGMVGEENLILERANSNRQIITTQTTRIDQYTAQVEALLTSLSMPNGWTDVIGNVIINTVTPLDPSIVPTPGSLTLPGFTGIVFNPVPALPPVPTINTDHDEPEEPTAPTTNMEHTVGVYTSEVRTALIAKILDGIANPGTGIPASVETALHERNLERQRVANEKAMDMGVEELSSRALSFPQYAVDALVNEIAKEVDKQAHNSSNEIEIAMADLAQKNAHFMIEQGGKLEDILAKAFETYETLSLDAKKAIADFVLRKYAEMVAAYKSKWEGISSMLRAKVDAANVVVAQHNALIAGFRAETDGKIAQVDMISKERSSLVELAGHETTVYKARVEGATAWYNALGENQKAQLQKSELELRKAEAELKALLDSFISINSLREKLIDNFGGTSAQVMSAATNAISVNLGANVTSTKTVSESYEHREGVSVSHSQGADENHNIRHLGEPLFDPI
jgi:hypothetical protein